MPSAASSAPSSPVSPALGGPGFTAGDRTSMAADYSIVSARITQAKAVGVTVIWTAVVAFIAYSHLVVGLRVRKSEEREGLDISAHGSR